MRRLIINADDLGLTAGVNRAILECHTAGVVSSATLMANGAAFDHAVELSRTAAKLSLGCHVVLVDGAPVLDPDSVPSLASNRMRSGRFQSRLASFAARALAGGFDRDELVNEIVAQVKRVQDSGVRVTHLDTHKHTHVFPVILDALIRAARICGVPAVRNPFAPGDGLRLSFLVKQPSLWKRYSQVQLLRTFSGHFRRAAKRAGLATPDGIVGVVETGSFDEARLRAALRELPEGTWELVTHPGYDDAELRAARTRLLQSREDERRWLLSPELRDFLNQQQIELGSYRDLVPQ